VDTSALVAAFGRSESVDTLPEMAGFDARDSVDTSGEIAGFGFDSLCQPRLRTTMPAGFQVAADSLAPDTGRFLDA
jgi:hypothetical protein